MSYLTDNKLTLRKPEPEDLEFLYSIENNSEFWHISETKAPYTKWHLKQHIENSSYDVYSNKELRLIITSTNDNISLGIIDLFEFDPFNQKAGISIVIDKKYQKSGYADNALKLIIDYAFNFLLLHQLYCYIDSDNAQSIKLFTKNGFTKTGVLADWKRSKNGFNSVFIFQLINEQ